MSYQQSIVEGKIVRLSVSQLKTFELCPRKWWYNKIAKVPEPLTKAQAVGLEGHSRWDAYYRGQPVLLTDQDQAALPLLPKPSEFTKPELKLEKLTLLRIPFQGSIDLLYEKPDEIEVFDFKYQASLRPFTETTVQAWGYLYEAVLRFERPLYRFSHIYISKKTPKALKVDEAFTAREIERNWLVRGDLVKRMQETAARKSASEVDCKPQACYTYGPCPYLAICSKNKEKDVMGFLDTLSKITAEESSVIKIPEIPGILPPDAPVEAKPFSGQQAVSVPQPPPIPPEKKPRGRPPGGRSKVILPPDERPTSPEVFPTTSIPTTDRPQPPSVTVTKFEPAPTDNGERHERVSFREADRIKVRHSLKIGLPGYSSAEVSLELDACGDLTKFKELNDKVKALVLEESRKYVPNGGK